MQQYDKPDDSATAKNSGTSLPLNITDPDPVIYCNDKVTVTRFGYYDERVVVLLYEKDKRKVIELDLLDTRERFADWIRHLAVDHPWIKPGHFRLVSEAVYNQCLEARGA